MDAELAGPAIGCMRLSTEPDRDDARAEAVVIAALDAGARLLDTADVYGSGSHDLGHNERLVARVLRRWSGPRQEVVVATKGGLTRPDGRWVPDGRARHLRAACEASLRALDVDRIDLYQLHAVDPGTPLRTSVRALAKLQRDGLVARVGLCNVTVDKIEAARAEVELASVQIALDPWNPTALRGGVIGYCREHGIRVLAHSPLGGPRKLARVRREPLFAALAEARGCSPVEIVLAWLRSLDPAITVLPGPTQVDTARSCGAIANLVLTDDEIARIDAKFDAAAVVRRTQPERRPRSEPPGEVVLVMGMQGAGKSTAARILEGEGYLRLNRDEAGGTLRKLHRQLDAELGRGVRKVVVDNTYPARATRNEVVEIAWRHGLSVRCRWHRATVEDARINVVRRMLERHGEVLAPERLAALARKDPHALPPRALLAYERELEPPSLAEGFESIDIVDFEPDEPTGVGSPLVFVDVDGLRGLPDRAVSAVREQLHELAAHASLVGLRWCPQGTDWAREHEAIEARFGVAMASMVCPHGAGPPVCWCRPPMPGLVLEAVHRHGTRLRDCELFGFGERLAAAWRLRHRPLR